MALQDLTPQLRTRLSRMERAVGWFVLLATGLLIFGFGYYVYNMARTKGWFTPKFKYQTGLNNVSGIKEGDPIKLMGKPVGEVTRLTPNRPEDFYGMTVEFYVLKPNYGYIWDDSRVKVSSDFLGNRFLEITKGKAGVPTVAESTNGVAQALLNFNVIRATRDKVLQGLRTQYPDMERTNRNKFDWLLTDELKRVVQAGAAAHYTNLTEIYWIDPEESPALNERLERVANQVEEALPTILNLTNQLYAVLSNTAVLTANLSDVASSARPAVSNLAMATAHLDQPGALGEWLLPTNINQKLDAVLSGADATMDTANTNIAALAQSLYQSLENLANITSNLNDQVESNTNIISQLSKAIVDADNLVQGLKKHWLLRSAFKDEKKNSKSQPKSPSKNEPVLPPKMQDRR
jgi:hypothetical protein